MCCETQSSQVNYLTDESDDVGKGANTISLVHHYFQSFGLKERHLKLHADICVGQSKNNASIHYSMWRITAGLSETIEYLFMLANRPHKIRS